MKIAIVCDYFQADIGYAKIKVAQELQKLKHDVTVVTSDRYFPFHNYEQTMKPLLGERVQKVGKKKEQEVSVIRLPTYLELFTRVFYTDLERSLRYLKPDVVIVFGISTYSAYKVALLKRVLGFKIVLADSHLISEFLHGNQLLKKIMYGVFRTFFAKVINESADKIVALQPGTQKVISNIYGLQKKSYVIDNGTDCTLFVFNLKNRKKIRKKLDINTNDTVLIYTGKIIREKGIDVLIQAFHNLAAHHTDLKCLVVGNGSKDYLALCKKIAGKYQNRVIFIPAVDQKLLSAYYSAADLAIWPKQESLAMNDAAANSLAFICSDSLKGTKRVSNHNAALYKTGDALSLTKVIEKLIKNKKKLKEMGKNGRQLAVKELSWNHLAELYIKF